MANQTDISEIYNRNVDTVFRLCYSYLKNRADTEDAVAETFLKLLKCKKVFESAEHEKAWLIVTSSNVCKNVLRSFWKRKVNFSDTQEKDDYTEDETVKAIFELPPKYKTVVYLYYYEGYKADEIAKMLKKPSSTVRNFLSEGRNLLRQKLGEAEVN